MPKKPDYIMYAILIAILYMLYLNVAWLQAIFGGMGNGTPMPPLQILPPWLDDVIPLPPGMNYSMPGENYTRLITSQYDCLTACLNAKTPQGALFGFTNGSCMWDSEAQTYMTNPVGQCWFAGDRHCGNVGDCSCRCWKNSDSPGGSGGSGGSGGAYCDQYTCGKGGQPGTCPADFPTCAWVGFSADYSAWACVNDGTQTVAPEWKSGAICNVLIHN